MTNFLNNIYSTTLSYYQSAQGAAENYYATQKLQDGLIDTAYPAAQITYLAKAATEDAAILDFANLPSLNYQTVSKLVTSNLDFHTKFCNNQEVNCAFKLGRYITYDLPNASPSIFSWGASKISQVSTTCLDYLSTNYEAFNNFRNGQLFSTASSAAENGYCILKDFGNDFASKSTELILGKAPLALDGQTPFQATDLILPILFQNYFINKTKENLGECLFHIKLLATMQTEYTTAYACGRKFGYGPITNNEDYYTWKQLAHYAGMDALCAGLWGTLSFVSVYKIFDVIAEASGSTERAFFIASSIALANIALPILFQNSPIAYLNPEKVLQSIRQENADEENPIRKRRPPSVSNTERVQIKHGENGSVIIEIGK